MTVHNVIVVFPVQIDFTLVVPEFQVEIPDGEIRTPAGQVRVGGTVAGEVRTSGS